VLAYIQPPLEQLNISRIGFLVNRYLDIQIGYSTHERSKNKNCPIALAIGQGATVFEKHVALPTEKYGINEYSSSMEDLSQWMESAHQSIIALNDVNQIEHKNEDEINTLMDLKKGSFCKILNYLRAQSLRHSDIFLSIPPEKGQLLANDLSKYVEYTLSKSIEPNKPIFKKDSYK
jgi:Sialic acid synthase